MSRNGKVLVAMSGGVDSSVAASLLRDEGYECIGVFMRVGAAGQGAAGADEVPERRLKHGCCSVADALDARAIAARLGMSFYVLNFEADFARIVDYFVDEYARGRTPNPCVQCNIRLKFGKLLDYADLLDAQYVATGHYARIVERAGQCCLARAANHAKDQSYVLFGIQRDQLCRCRFPLGAIGDKAEVRRMAADLGLAVHDKPDSQEICFVPDDDYKMLVRARRPDTIRPGEIVDDAGRVLARHEGIANFTIGQRRGLGFAAGKPVYVTRLNVLENRVTVGPQEALRSAGLTADRINWLTDPPPPAEPQPVRIKIRHTHTPAPGTVLRDSGPPTGRSAPRAAESPAVAAERLTAQFDTPQLAVAPGQAAVFYDAADVVLAGGWIDAAIPMGAAGLPD
jgi:tRNA-specific 2-thiouridylase